MRGDPAADDARLVDLVAPRAEQAIGAPVGETGRARLRAGMPGLKVRAKTVTDLAAAALFYVRSRPIPVDAAAQKVLTQEARENLGRLLPRLAAAPEWSEAALEAIVRQAAEEWQLKLGALAQPLRAALVGSTVSPGIFEVIVALGRDESLARIGDAAGAFAAGAD